MPAFRQITWRSALFAAAALGCFWLFYTRAVLPLRDREHDFLRKRAELQERLESTRRKLIAIKDAEQKLTPARADLDRLLPEGTAVSAMVSFPENIAAYFSEFGIPSAVVRLATTRKEPGLPNYERVFWSVGVPIPQTDRSAEALLLAVAGLEEQDRLIEVTDFSVQPDPEDPHRGVASIGIVILARK